MSVENSDEYTDDSLFNIASWGADMSFRELIQMYEEEDLIRPEFQRNYVWKKHEASRFIESVLLGLPVPSIFLANDRDNKKLIIDGYQRIMTVFDYVHRKKFGSEEVLFRLTNSDNINKRWRNKSYDELLPEDQRRLRSTTIHAIVFEQKFPKNDDTSMFQIFSRINTSGRSLNAQEIRNCVCQGRFNQLLIELNSMAMWRDMYGVKDKEPRMLDIELILRYFAIRDIMRTEEARKQINLRKYLDIYMKTTADSTLLEKRDSFSRMISFVKEVLGVYAFTTTFDRRSESKIKINPIIFEAISVATDIYLSRRDVSAREDVDYWARRNMLLENEEFKEASSRRTTDLANIEKRINLAASIIYGINP